MNSKGRVQSIDRAIAVLNCFSLKRQELRLTEIADELDLNKRHSWYNYYFKISWTN